MGTGGKKRKRERIPFNVGGGKIRCTCLDKGKNPTGSEEGFGWGKKPPVLGREGSVNAKQRERKGQKYWGCTWFKTYQKKESSTNNNEEKKIRGGDENTTQPPKRERNHTGKTGGTPNT